MKTDEFSLGVMVGATLALLWVTMEQRAQTRPRSSRAEEETPTPPPRPPGIRRMP